MKKIVCIALTALILVLALPHIALAESSDNLKPAETTRISYLGPAGTYTEEATKFFFDGVGQLMPEATVDEAIAALLNGEADYAVIPQENTLGGAVTNYVDALIAQENVYVVGEVVLPISQTLLGVPGATLEGIKTICSHAQGLTQSKQWCSEHLPDAVTEEMASTAAAASYVAQQQDLSIAAIAAPGAAELYKLEVLAENVQITDANKTRFYVLSLEKNANAGLTHAVFVASCEANWIDDILVEIHSTGLELVTIHDRPEGSALGSYHYIIEVENPNGISAEQLVRIDALDGVRCFGSFNTVEKGTAGPDNGFPFPDSSGSAAGGYSDDMKFDDGVDLSAEDGADSVERDGDHADSPYFRHPDFFHLESTDTLTILHNFETIQQSSEWSCGVASALMVLEWYDLRGDYTEESLAELRPQGLEPGATSLSEMVAMFDGVGGFKCYSAIDAGEDVYDIFTFEYIRETLAEGDPIMIGWNDWGGHWQVIIGYDTMGTETPQDDVIIVADPYDTTDHNQDGYGIYGAERFLYNFTFYNFFESDELNDMCFLVAKPA